MPQQPIPQSSLCPVCKEGEPDYYNGGYTCGTRKTPAGIAASDKCLQRKKALADMVKSLKDSIVGPREISMADVNRQETDEETLRDFLRWWNPRNEDDQNPNVETNPKARRSFEAYVWGKCDGVYIGKRDILSNDQAL